MKLQLRTVAALSFAFAMGAALPVLSQAEQTNPNNVPESQRTSDNPQTMSPDATSPGTSSYGLTAALDDAVANTSKREAAVDVHVTGVNLVDPASVSEQPRTGEGHLEYRVDNGPTIDTTETRLRFHDLSSGNHTIEVALVGNDHK